MLVRERPASLLMRDLAHDIGVSPKWLGDFTSGKFDNPSARIIERLYVRLTGKQLVDQ